MKRVLFAWVLSRLFLVTLTAFNGSLPYGHDGSKWAEHESGYRYRQIESRIFDSWHRFDARAYHSIAVRGYDRIRMPDYSNTAFFPGYSWLGWLVFHSVGLKLTGSDIADPTPMFHALQMTSTLSFLAALFLFYRWCLRRFDQKTAVRAGILMVLAPWTFIFDAPFSESTFLLFTLLALELAERRHWLLALCAASCCVLTRSVGLTVTLALAWIYLFDRPRQRRGFSFDVFAFLLPLLALWAYFVHVGEANGYPWAYFEQQKQRFGHNFPDLHGIVDLFLPGNKNSAWDWARDILQILVVSGSLVATWGLYRHLRGTSKKEFGVVVLTGVLLLLPLLSGSLVSMPRYCSVLFPVYALVAWIIPSDRFFYVLVGVLSLMLAGTWIVWIHNYPLIV